MQFILEKKRGKALSSSGQDGALSRLKLGFESRQGHVLLSNGNEPPGRLGGSLVDDEGRGSARQPHIYLPLDEFPLGRAA